MWLLINHGAESVEYAPSSNKRKGNKMKKKSTRLEKAEAEYESQLHEWLTNPKNEDLSPELTEEKLSAAFQRFLDELLADEAECAAFIFVGGRLDEHLYLKTVFDHFKSQKIFEAIKQNCAVAFSGESFTEAEELLSARRELIAYMESCLRI